MTLGTFNIKTLLLTNLRLIMKRKIPYLMHFLKHERTKKPILNHASLHFLKQVLF